MSGPALICVHVEHAFKQRSLNKHHIHSNGTLWKNRWKGKKKDTFLVNRCKENCRRSGWRIWARDIRLLSCPTQWRFRSNGLISIEAVFKKYEAAKLVCNRERTVSGTLNKYFRRLKRNGWGTLRFSQKSSRNHNLYQKEEQRCDIH